MPIPLKQSHSFPAIFKFQILRHHVQQIWQSHKTKSLPLIPFSPHLYIGTNSIWFRNSNILPYTPFVRPRTHYPSSPAISSSTASQDSTHNPNKTVRAMIKGRVQGVFYRNWTVENATQLGLKGWVRNRRDGSVEALFSGAPDQVQEMEQRCRRGPPDAMVTRFEVFPSDEDPGSGFERRGTVWNKVVPDHLLT